MSYNLEPPAHKKLTACSGQNWELFHLLERPQIHFKEILYFHISTPQIPKSRFQMINNCAHLNWKMFFTHLSVYSIKSDRRTLSNCHQTKYPALFGDWLYEFQLVLARELPFHFVLFLSHIRNLFLGNNMTARQFDDRHRMRSVVDSCAGIKQSLVHILIGEPKIRKES